jgi:error-prone DNA polymerase
VELSKEELRTIAELGALNCFAEHRRAAMWRVEETIYEDLLDTRPNLDGLKPSRFRRKDGVPRTEDSPLLPMSMPERVKADYTAMNLSTGPHPMKLLRARLPDIWRASDLRSARHGSTVQIAGNVICRQRPGTAKGFVFVSLEDETGVSNAIVTPDLFERMRLLITEEPFLLIEGVVQNTDNVVLIKAEKIQPLAHEKLIGSESHDFH